MQKLRFSRYLKPTLVIADVVAIASLYLFFYMKNDRNITENYFIVIILLGVFWSLLSGKTKIYHTERSLTFTKYIERLINQLFAFSLTLVLFAKVLAQTFLNENIYIIIILLFFVQIFLKSMLFFFVKYIRTKGINYRNAMFIGDNTAIKILKSTIGSRKDYGYKIFNFTKPLEKVHDLIQFWNEYKIHTLFISAEHRLGEEITAEASKYGLKIILVPENTHHNFYNYELNYIETQPILLPSKFPLEYYSNFLLKRITDIIISVLFLAFVGIWLYPLIALLIKLNDRGTVFFIQKRYGYKNEVFNCFKFRTMTEHQPQSITKIGKFLRKTSLDETPQFINVLLGGMSVVGPRPHMLSVDNNYKPKINKYGVRSMVKPGITGLAQIRGHRGEKENMELEMQKRILSDYFYVKNWNITLDLIIIFKTLILLIEGDKNAH